MFKNILFSLMAIVALVGNEAQCGKDGESSNSTSDEAKKSAPKVNPWVKPYLPKRVENQRDVALAGGIRLVAIDYLAVCPDILAQDKEAYRLSGEGHRSSVFERCVRNAQVAFLKDYRARRETYIKPTDRDQARVLNASLLEAIHLAEHIEVFHKYKHWGQAAQDVAAVLEAYYGWIIPGLSHDVKWQGPFADRTLPFYRKSIAGIPGKHRFERDMALFMHVIQDDVRRNTHKFQVPPPRNEAFLELFEEPYVQSAENILTRIKGSHGFDTSNFYYDRPETNKEAGAVERFMRSQAILTRFELASASDPFARLTLDQYRELSKLEVLFDSKIWWDFTEDLIAGNFGYKDASILKVLSKSYSAQSNVDDDNVRQRMMACYQWLFDKTLEEFQCISESERSGWEKRLIPLFRGSQAWASKIVQYYGSRVTARCDVIGENFIDDDEADCDICRIDVCHVRIPEYTQKSFWRLEQGVLKAIKLLWTQGSHVEVLSEDIKIFMDTYHIREAVEKRLLAARQLTLDEQLLILNKISLEVKVFKNREDQRKAFLNILIDHSSVMFELYQLGIFPPSNHTLPGLLRNAAELQNLFKKKQERDQEDSRQETRVGQKDRETCVVDAFFEYFDYDSHIQAMITRAKELASKASSKGSNNDDDDA